MKVEVQVMRETKNEIVLNNVPGLSVHIQYSEREGERVPFATIPMHYHNEIELLFVIKGGKRVVVDGVSYDAGEGDIIFVNSGVPHTVYNTLEPLATFLVQFKEKNFVESDISQMTSFNSKLKSISEVAVGLIKNKEVFASALAILNESREMDVASDMFIKGEICKILGFLYRGKYLVKPDSVKAPREAEKIDPIIAYINKNYNEVITLDDASALLGFDPSYFCRLFKRATGASFTEYLNFVRVSNAEKLLTKTRKSILEISEAVGFSSVSYFNRIFKKYKSCSPRYYRSAKHGENM